MKQIFLVLFILAACLNILGVYMNYLDLAFATKPFILINLFAYYFISTPRDERSSIILLALLFSLLGDTLLMWGDVFYMFLLGILAFLFAQVCYIKWSTMYSTLFRFDKLFVIYALLFGSMLIVLSPLLGDYLWPMMVYGLFLFSMSMQMTRISLGPNNGHLTLMFGGLLFVISDLCIAFSKFIPQWSWTAFVIMPTYVLAQGLLVYGVKKNDHAEKNKKQ